ncbi:MAG: lipopolysaccharide heptosyltransferase I [Chlamydiota bacterium]
MKVLIIKTSSLGDIIHTFPVVDFIRHHFPESQLDWIVEKPYSALLLSHPEINKVIEVDTKKWKNSFFSTQTWKSVTMARQTIQQQHYDIAFDLQGNIKSGVILSCVSANRKVGFDRKSVPEWPNTFFTSEKFNPPIGNNIREDYLSIVKEAFNVDAHYNPSTVSLKVSSDAKEWVDDLFVLPKTNILLCPGSRWKNKRLPQATLKEYMNLMHRENSDVYFLLSWGSEEELDTCKVLQQKFDNISVVLPKLELPVLHYLMSRVQLVFAMDSLPLHLAGITKTPTLAVFGPSSAKKYAPIGEQHKSVKGQCPYGQSFEKRCPILRTCPTGACIQSISAEELVDC